MAPSTAGPPPRHSRPLSKLDLQDQAEAVAFPMSRAGQSWYTSVAVAPARRRPTGLGRAVTGELERLLGRSGTAWKG
jgi:hypothetical protein